MAEKGKSTADVDRNVEHLDGAYWQVVIQSPDAWTPELFRRPYGEPF